MKILTLSFLIAIGVSFSAFGKSLPKKAEAESQIIVVKGYAYNDDELKFFVENKQWNSIEDFSTEPVYTASSLNGDGVELESIDFNATPPAGGMRTNCKSAADGCVVKGRKFSVYMHRLPGIAKIQLRKGSQVVGEKPVPSE